MATKKKVEEAPKEKVKLTVSQILADLGNGLDRKAIRAKYGLSATDVSRIFQNPKLKGARVKSAPQFELEDDTESVEASAKPKAVAATEEKSKTKAKAAATIAETKVEEKDDDEEKDNEEDLGVEDNSGGGIKEVSSPEDNVNLKDEVEDKTKPKTGLW